MMESYIAVLTKGICQSEENGSFLSKDFDARKAYLAGSIKGKKNKKKAKQKKKQKPILGDSIPTTTNPRAKDSLSLDSAIPYFHIFSSI